MVKLKQLVTLPGVQVHYADPDNCIASAGLSLCLSDDAGHNWQEVARIPAPLLRKTGQSSVLFNRLVRGGIHAVLPAGNHSWLVVAERQIFLISADGSVRSLCAISRGRRPLRRGLCVVDEYLYLGEYWSNPERNAAHIYKIHISTGEQIVFYTFFPGTIRHIHTVDKDPYSQNLWVSTGDEDAECRLLLLDAQTGQAEIVGQGGQKWRVVSFAFRPRAVYWGTDNHRGQNDIWRYDRASGQTHKIGQVVGPVYYNTVLDDAIIMGTTMEKGEGQQDGYGRLYAIDAQDNIREIWKAKKDRWSAHWFGYGVFEFAEGCVGGNKFWLTAKGFTGGLRSILFELTDE